MSASAEMPRNTSAMKTQLPSISPVHPLSCRVALGNRNLSPQYLPCTKFSPAQYLNTRNTGSSGRAARVEAAAPALLSDSVFLKRISSRACYKPAFLLKMSSSNINHESDESIYSRQACIGRKGVEEREKIDR